MKERRENRKCWVRRGRYAVEVEVDVVYPAGDPSRTVSGAGHGGGSTKSARCAEKGGSRLRQVRRRGISGCSNANKMIPIGPRGDLRGRRQQRDRCRFDREPLHSAASDGDLTCVKQLVAEGFEVKAFDDLGKTPLHHAAEREHLTVAAFLLECGADVNAQHESTIGNTPLGEIAGRSSLEMARLLVAAGADPTIFRIEAVGPPKRPRRLCGRRGRVRHHCHITR